MISFREKFIFIVKKVYPLVQNKVATFYWICFDALN